MSHYYVGPHRNVDMIRLGPVVAGGSEGILYRGRLNVPQGPVEVAVKMLQPGHLERLPEWTLRWREQVTLLRRVSLPGLVAVHGGFVGPLPHLSGEADVNSSSLYLVMDWIDGIPLDRWRRSTALEPDQLLLTLVPVASALDVLHSGALTDSIPIVHRDVKPANILVSPEGETVLVDVGGVQGIAAESRRSGVVGTPGYIAPEVRADGDYTVAADRYGLGAVAYFLLTGHEPPVDANFPDLAKTLGAAALLQDRPDLVSHVVAMLNPDPTQRPSNLANWVAQLRRSSLVPGPGEDRLAPLVPVERTEHVQSRSRGHFPARVKVATTVAIVLIVVVGLILTVPSRAPEDRDRAEPATGVLEQERNSDPSELDHITVRSHRIKINQAMPLELQALFRPSTTYTMRLPEDTYAVLVEFTDDPEVKVVLADGLVRVIIVGGSARYFDRPELVAGASTSSIGLALIGDAKAGAYMARSAMISEFRDGVVYWVYDYDCSKQLPIPVDQIGRIIVVAHGSESLIPRIFGVQCMERI